MLVRRCPEPAPAGPLGPGNRVTLHQLLHAVLPEDPGVHSLWGARCGHRELAQLLWCQAAVTIWMSLKVEIT